MAIYFKEVFKKDKIVLHHTASNHNANNVLTWWEQQDNGISTPYIVDGLGFITHVYPSKYWSYHLGIKEPNHFISKKSIPIELTNWGSLKIKIKQPKEKDNGFFNLHNKKVFDIGSKKVYQNEWRSRLFWHKYTDQQLIALRQLIIDLSNEHSINIEYKEYKFELSEAALKGEPGLWFHCNYRLDKLDMHPQPEFIDMLLSL